MKNRRRLELVVGNRVATVHQQGEKCFFVIEAIRTPRIDGGYDDSVVPSRDRWYKTFKGAEKRAKEHVNG